MCIRDSIDPKVVELAEYNGIPHLLMPVVTEPRKAAGALGGAVQEMERRYHLFAENNVRDIKSFNKLAATDPNLEKMPYIAIIIDELADLMMVVGKDVEDSICRIAQKARAARIMDEMEEKGIIGPYEGAKPRAVLISRQQWLEMQMNQPDE